MESETIKELTKVKFELTKLANELLDLEERTSETLSLALSIINLSDEAKRLLDINCTCAQVNDTEAAEEFKKRIKNYKTIIQTDPLYTNQLNLDDVKDLKESHSCRNCKYSHGKYRCITPEQPDYYVKNDCPYHKDI